MMTAIIAHRGASALATHENTLEAFQIAINLQADFAEFDIRRTKDHQLIAFHNPDLNGTDIRQLTMTKSVEHRHTRLPGSAFTGSIGAVPRKNQAGYRVKRNWI